MLLVSRVVWVLPDPIDFHLDPDRDNYAVMGNPVAHSKSPQIHLAFARQTSQSLNYQAILVPAGKFATAVLAFRDAGGRGLNVTVPYKQDAWRLTTTCTARAGIAGAVNTITFADSDEIKGDNTDGTGLLRDLERHTVPVTGSRILILGAGGAVRGILGPLLEKQPASVVIANRTVGRAETLVQEHTGCLNMQACPLDGLPAGGNFDLVINAISSGLQAELPALPDALISNQAYCYDMVYSDVETVFVRWARQHGARLALDGLGMLVEQAAEAFYIWRGVRPETAPVIAMLRRQSGVRSQE